MPTYAYECPNCGIEEVEQSIKDAPLELCERCGMKVERVIYPVGCVLKGSGFYQNDYKNKGK